MTRTLTEKDLAYERISAEWSGFINSYDTSRRLEVMIEDFLGPTRVEGRSCLDAGCGLGEFTSRLSSMGPSDLWCCDISPALVEQVHNRVAGVHAFTADLLTLDTARDGRTFDVVVSSEVIEHTPDPELAVAQLCRAIKPGGYLVLSVPNHRWKWLLYLAQTAKLRTRYQGYENWVRPADLIRWLEEGGMTVERREGIHLIPWHFLPRRLLRWIDRRVRKFSYSWALNLAVAAKHAG